MNAIRTVVGGAGRPRAATPGIVGMTAIVILGLAGTARAQSTVIFTDDVNGLGTTGSYIKSVTTPGNVNTLVSFGPGVRRLSDITPGPNGSYFFGDGITPPGNDPNHGTGQILRVDNLFTSTVVTRVDTGDRPGTRSVSSTTPPPIPCSTSTRSPAGSSTASSTVPSGA